MAAPDFLAARRNTNNLLIRRSAKKLIAPSNIDALADLRFARSIERLHRRGPRLIYKLLCQLAAERLLRQRIEDLVQQYLRIDETALRAAGGDCMPPAPIRQIRLDSEFGQGR